MVGDTRRFNSLFGWFPDCAVVSIIGFAFRVAFTVGQLGIVGFYHRSCSHPERPAYSPAHTLLVEYPSIGRILPIITPHGRW